MRFAVGIADEGGVIAFAVLGSQARRAVGRAAGREPCGMERVDQFDRPHAQRHVGAPVDLDRRHGRTQVEPKFRIGLAEADGPRSNDELLVTDGGQYPLIEAR